VKERIKKLLAAGMKASEVAATVGCSPSYVSQLLGQSEFKEAVALEMTTFSAESDEEQHLDKRYQILEHKILNNITDALPQADLPQLTRALEVVAKRQTEMKRAKAPVLANNVNNGTVNITNISLPAHILTAPAPTVSVNENNEIISIDSKPLAPLSSNGVRNIFEQMRAKQKIAKALKGTDFRMVKAEEL
jgi:tRNA A37 N6-isopentenylltransferase MiaA